MALDTTPLGETDADGATFTLLAGEAEVDLTGTISSKTRGQVLIVAKPDGTVLVHDTQGYKPVAWITRADTVTVDSDTNTLTAVDEDQWLRVDLKHASLSGDVSGSPAGEPVSTCPNCNGTLIRSGREIHCIGCRDRYGLPAGAEVLSSNCECGLPQMRIERGDVFELCVDRECQPMEELIAERFDGRWACPEPECNGELRVLRRDHLLVGCDAYPECDAAFSLPHGRVDGRCGCGLPRFDVDGELECLDVTCESTN